MLANSQEQKNQKTQNDQYSNLDPKKNPGTDSPDPIRNIDPNRRPGAGDNTTNPGNPSQYPVRHPDEVPVQEPNEVPQQGDLGGKNA